MIYLFGLTDNINWVDEDNYSIVDEHTKIWSGKLPYESGSTFPTEDIKERARISKTNELIYNNKIEDIFSNIISIFPEIDPMYGWQIRELVTSLPYFKNCTNAWVGLVAGDSPLIDLDANSSAMEERLSEVVESSNFVNIFQDEVRSRFIDTISAYRVDVDINNKPTIVKIRPRNFEIFVNHDSPESIEVVLVFSIYKQEGSEYIDFVEYHYNGLIRKTTFEYSEGTVGNLVSTIEDRAFGGLFDESPIIVFKHNAVGNGFYGTDQYRYWSPSMLAGMRTLQNILRLGERTREMIRKVPTSAIKKDSVTGGSVFYNKGTVAYDDKGDGTSPDMAFIVPDVPIEKTREALEICIKQIGIDTQLGSVFFNLDTLGSRLSGDSIKAALYPARLEAKRITTEMRDSIKEMIIKLGYMAGLQVNKSKLSIEFYDGFPKDELDDIKKVQLRLESSCPSLTLEDAIMKLDRVPLRVAKQRASEIRKLHSGNEKVEQIVKLTDSQKNDLGVDQSVANTDKVNDMSTIEASPGDGAQSKDTLVNKQDNTLWDSQLANKPKDIVIREEV